MNTSLSLSKLKLSQWALLGSLFLLQSYLVRFSVGAYPANLQELLIIVVAVLFVGDVVKENRIKEVLKRVREHKILLAFLGLGILASVVAFAGGFEGAEAKLYFVRHAKFLVFALVLAYLFVELLRSEPERLAGLRALGYGALAFGLFSAAYNLLGYNVAYDYRLQGPLDSAVYLAFYLAPFFIFFVMQAAKGKMAGKAWLWDSLAALILLGLLIATGSMGALAGAFGALVVYFWNTLRTGKEKRKKSRGIVWLKIGALAVGLALLVALFWLKIAPALQTNNTSLGERGEVWATTLVLLQEPQHAVFGLGLGQFQPQYAENVERVIGRAPLDFVVLQPHNLFLLFLVQFGILGLLLVLVCMGFLARRLRADDGGFSGELTAQRCVRILLLYFFLHGMIDTPFFKNDLLFLLILFLEVGLVRKE